MTGALIAIAAGVAVAAGIAVGAIIANNCNWYHGGVYVGPHGAYAWGGSGYYHGNVNVNVNNFNNYNNRNVNVNNVNNNRNANDYGIGLYDQGRSLRLSIQDQRGHQPDHGHQDFQRLGIEQELHLFGQHRRL